jgi:predicted secreted acid phosphatase
MIIYNVTIKLTHDIHKEWVRWMKEEHMPEILNIGLFSDSRLCRLLEQDEKEGVTYVAQYFCDNMDDYNDYIKEHAPAMREKGLKKFGDQFIAFRTVMKIEA